MVLATSVPIAIAAPDTAVPIIRPFARFETERLKLERFSCVSFCKPSRDESNSTLGV